MDNEGISLFPESIEFAVVESEDGPSQCWIIPASVCGTVRFEDGTYRGIEADLNKEEMNALRAIVEAAAERECVYIAKRVKAQFPLDVDSKLKR